MHVRHFFVARSILLASSSCSLSAFFGTKGGGSGTWLPRSNVYRYPNGWWKINGKSPIFLWMIWVEKKPDFLETPKWLATNWMMIPSLYIHRKWLEITKHHPFLNCLFGLPGCKKPCPVRINLSPWVEVEEVSQHHQRASWMKLSVSWHGWFFSKPPT